jgi:AraC family transcriptional regulator of adaptative response / DNA-3-methyladenine glycosylase II
MLIQTSGLRLVDVAYAAGFSSVRQFNDTIRAAYGRTPTELRRTVARAGRADAPAPAAAGPGVLTVRLAFREPLHWERLLRFFADRAVAGVEEVCDGRYRRTLRLPRGHGIVALRVPPARAREPRHVECELRLADLRDLTAAVQRCRRLLDLDADPAAPAERLARDPLLAPRVRDAPGLRVPGTVEGSELAIRAILGQQVSVAAARTAAGRLTQTLGEPLSAPDGTLTHLFPSPAAIAAADPALLPGPGSRRATLRALARLLADGELAIDPGSDRAEVATALLAIPGIGPWTEQYIAMRGLCDPDAFLPSDLGVRRALEALGEPWRGPREAALRAEPWRPWRAYALQHLWGALATPARARAANGAIRVDADRVSSAG